MRKCFFVFKLNIAKFPFKLYNENVDRFIYNEFAIDENNGGIV